MDHNSVDSSSNSPLKRYQEVADYQLNLPTWSLENLKNLAVQQSLPRPRSLAWSILLNALPPLNMDLISSLRSHRNFYIDLREKLLKDPRAVHGDDPLSQDNQSVWKQHFCDKELQSVIKQDVVRTFPDELYFRDQDVQDMMVRILFFWARSHSNVGYRQGMHEILAPALFELYLDRTLAPSSLGLYGDKLKCILDEEFLEHDSFMLFSAIMKGLERFYVTGELVSPSSGWQPNSRFTHNPNEVVRYLERVREEFLVPCDQELATHLQEINISMELFGIRWLRLLFGREFPRSEVADLWSFIFADGPTLPNLHYIIVAMLISMRKTLLSAEAGAVLAALMRPARRGVRHVSALALHLRAPLHHARPPEPPPSPPHDPPRTPPHHSAENEWSEVQGAVSGEELGSAGGAGGVVGGVVEGVAEGADVARELAALALVRARLPPAAAALARALPRAPPAALQPLQQILQLAALLQCRNHALVDVETALEAAEGQTADRVGKRFLVPVTATNRRTGRPVIKPPNKVREVPLEVFREAECPSSDLPFKDPLGLRTE